MLSQAAAGDRQCIAEEVCMIMVALLLHARSCQLDLYLVDICRWDSVPLTLARPMLLRLDTDALGHLLVRC
jgi:hypothetical protein